MAEGVQVVRSALTAAWRRAEYQEIWLQFRTAGGGDVLAEVTEAVLQANQAIEGAGWGDDVFVEGVSASPGGPVAFMSRAFDKQGIFAWFQAFAGELEAAGLAGRVTAAPQAHFPQWLIGHPDHPFQLTAFVSYRTADLAAMDQRERQAGWNVDPQTTARVAEAAVAWGSFEGADTYFRSNLHQMRSRPDVSEYLAHSMSKFGMAGVAYLRRRPMRFVAATFGAAGRSSYQVWDPSSSWQDRLEKAVDALVAFPEETDLGLVQYAPAFPCSWSTIAAGLPRLPELEEHHFRYNRHLDTQFVPDARGVQLLTDDHLRRARDLSEWIVEPLGGGNNLVRARNLAAWYAEPSPAPDVLARARHDFGEMVLTQESLSANPPPWQ